jgi:hypothetical protein
MGFGLQCGVRGKQIESYVKSTKNTKGGKMLQVKVTVDNAQVCTLSSRMTTLSEAEFKKEIKHELYLIYLHSNKK